jgi:hypothetical protein
VPSSAKIISARVSADGWSNEDGVVPRFQLVISPTETFRQQALLIWASSGGCVADKHAAPIIELGRHDEIRRCADRGAWRHARPSSKSKRNVMIKSATAVQTVVEGSALSATTIGACVSAASPAGTISLRKRRGSMRA